MVSIEFREIGRACLTISSSHSHYGIHERSQEIPSRIDQSPDCDHLLIHHHGRFILHDIWRECADHHPAQLAQQGSHGILYPDTVFIGHLLVDPTAAVSRDPYHGKRFVYHQIRKEQCHCQVAKERVSSVCGVFMCRHWHHRLQGQAG